MNKMLILLCVLTVGLVLTQPAHSQYTFYTGVNWVKIDQKPFSSAVKTQIKALTLQAVNEASLFSGTPIVNPKERDLTKYIKDIDKFYIDNDNKIIPIYFALKIASMKKEGIPEMQIKVYKAAVMKKLQILQ